jgi:transposase
MRKFDDQSRSLVALDQDSTLIAVIEMSQSSWLVGGLVPGLSREPEKKLSPDPAELLKLVHRWRDEAAKAGRPIARICVAYEAGRDGFWLARWLRQREIDCHVIHPTSIPVSREHRRAKTDRLDLGLLKRAFLGWLRGEAKHCSMARVPSLFEEDARRANRERQTLGHEATRIVNRLKSSLARLGIRGFNPKLRNAATRLAELRTGEGEAVPPLSLAELARELVRLALVRAQIRDIEKDRQSQLTAAPDSGGHRMIAQLVQVHGLGVDTADLLATETFSRRLRDRRAVARYAGLTGAPDESGSRRREKGLARAGNARVRHSMMQLAWRWLKFQPHSALAQWYRERTRDGRGDLRKTMIVALARKLLIALWRLVTTGELPEGVILRAAAATPVPATN